MAVTIVVIVAIMSGARKKARVTGPGSFVVRFHGGVLAIGIICMLLFGALLGLAIFQLWGQKSLAEEEIPLIFGVGTFFFLLGALLAVAAARFRLNVYPGRIDCVLIFGRSYTIQPADIAYVEASPTKLKAYDRQHHKLFSVDPTCKGKLELEGWLRRHNVKFGRDVSGAEALAIRLRTKRGGRDYLPTQQERQQQWQERQRLYMETPADLPENMEALLRPLLRQSIGISLGDPAVHCVVGRSKLGGEPDLPPDFQWEYFEGGSAGFCRRREA